MIIDCISNYGYFDSPEFVSFSLHTVTAISTPIHFIGLYCILFKTPKEKKSVKWYLLILHIWIMLFDYSFGVLIVPFLLLPAIAGFTMGVFQDFGVSMIFQAFLFTHIMSCMCMSIISIFENRFYVVSSFDKNHFWTFWRRPWLAAHYIAFGLMLYHDAQLVPEQTKELFEEIFRELPCLPEFIYHSPIFVAIHKDYMFARVTIFIFMFTFTSEVSFFAVSMVRNLMKQLKSKKMSTQTYRMQRSFFNALVIQISLPMIFVVIPLTGVLFLRYTNIYNQAMTNCCLIAIGAHGLSSTTIMLIAHRPYRQTVLSWMRREDGISRSRVKVSVTPMPI